jgi:hypothetical protein
VGQFAFAIVGLAYIPDIPIQPAPWQTLSAWWRPCINPFAPVLDRFASSAGGENWRNDAPCSPLGTARYINIPNLKD